MKNTETNPANKYNPVSVFLLDISGKVLRRIIFLGKVPHSISAALKNPANKSAAEVLKGYYGKNWKLKLGIEQTEKIAANLEYEKFGAFDALENYLVDDMELKENKKNRGQRVETFPAFAVNDRTSFCELSIWPHDTFWDISEKIAATFGIPLPYQHIEYKNAESGEMSTTYSIINEVQTAAVFREAADDPNIIIEKELFNLPIDYNLVNEEAAVVCQDTFYIAKSLAYPYIFVYDFRQIIGNNNLSVLEDKYRFDVFYYGFVFKYFPRINNDFLSIIIKGGFEIGADYYPLLFQKISAIGDKYREQEEIMEEIYGHCGKSPDKLRTSIINANCSIPTNKLFINIRYLFDLLQCDAEVHEIRGYLIYEKRQIEVIKHYIPAADIYFPPQLRLHSGKEGIIAAIKLPDPRYIFVSINQFSEIIIRCSWKEEDNYSFAENNNVIKKYVRPFVEKISGILGWNINMDIIRYLTADISLIYPKIISASQFESIKKQFLNYEAAGIIERNTNAKESASGLLPYIFKKGIYKFDLELIDKKINYTNADLFVNYYNRLTNVDVKSLWDQVYDMNGRLFNIIHRVSDIKFELFNIQEAEFLFVKSCLEYFCSIIKLPDKVKVDFDVKKKLKKLMLLDPELYDLKKHGYKRVYSVVCQSKMQPNIYTIEEYKSMSAKERDKLEEYWNFTLSEPAYYSCSNPQYSTMSYIPGKHPKEYCLPCCRKVEPTEESKKEKISKICREKKVYTEEKGEEAAAKHIIQFGKELDPGRFSHLPKNEISFLFADDKNIVYKIMGIKQIPSAILEVYLFFKKITINGFIEELKELFRPSPPNVNLDRDTTAANVIFESLVEGRIAAIYQKDVNFFAEIKKVYSGNAVFGPEAAELIDAAIIEIVRLMGYGIIFIDGTFVNIKKAAGQLYFILFKNSHGHFYPLVRYEEGQAKKVAVESDSKIIKNILSIYNEKNSRVPVDYEILCAAFGDRIAAKYVNKFGQIYGVKIDGTYFPCFYSSFIVDSKESITSLPQYDNISLEFILTIRGTLMRERLSSSQKKAANIKFVSCIKLKEKYAALVDTNNIPYWFSIEHGLSPPSADSLDDNEKQLLESLKETPLSKKILSLPMSRPNEIFEEDSAQGGINLNVAALEYKNYFFQLLLMNTAALMEGEEKIAADFDKFAAFVKKKVTVSGNIDFNSAEYTNIFVSCSFHKSQWFCDGKKLIVTPDIDLDLHIRLLHNYMNRNYYHVKKQIIKNYFKFIPHKNESIVINFNE